MVTKAMRPSPQWRAVALALLALTTPALGYTHCRGCGPSSGSSEKSAVIVSEGPRAGNRAAAVDSSLNALGYRTTIAKASQGAQPRVPLTRWQHNTADSLILQTPSSSRLPEGITASAVLDFFDRGGSVVLSLSPYSGLLQRDVASGLGVELPTNGSAYPIGSSASESLAHAHSVLLGEHSSMSALAFAEQTGDVDISGSIPLVVPADSETSLPLLSADGGVSSITADGTFVGSESAAAVAVQGRNGARALVLGSDALLRRRDPLSNALLSWALHESNTYRLASFRHYPSSQPQLASPERYKIQDHVDVEIDLKHWDATMGEWKPVSNISGLQIEWIMLDPHVRRTLTPRGNGTMGTQLKAPDVSGVFKWNVALRSLGATKVSLEEVCPIRPLRHDEYERFIPAAFPYYASSIACLCAVLATTAVVLGSE